MKQFLTIALILSMFVPHLYGIDKCDGQREKKRWERIQSMKVAFFTTKMELSKEEAEAFWPIYNKYREEIYSARKKIRENYKEIKRLSESSNPSELELKKVLNAYIDLYQKEAEIDKLYIFEFYKIIPVEKVAKMYVAEEEFRQEMINIWRKDKKQDGDKKGSNPNPKNND